jgi:hypothetical protein
MDRAKICPFYWMNTRKSVEDYVKCCRICSEANNPNRSKRHLLQKYIVGERFERVGIDIAGPFPETDRGNVYILVMMDYFSKLTEIFPLQIIQAETVADCVVRWMG